MQTLLSTKLNVPPARQALVQRPGLLAMLAKAGHCALTLVSAPPGYGKTTLVSSWLRDSGFPFTWLSLDEGDNDPVLFLEYFLTALRAVVPAIGPELLGLRQGAQSASYETLIALLINEAAAADDFFVALDDFQALRADSILAMLNLLIEHLPASMHVVLLSRSDPPLALPRLRARGQLLEIRAEQLRFSMPEIAQYYNQVVRLPLSASDVAAIETRTEGWIAGMQLAGLAMQADKEPQRFIASFTGSHAYIMDYLTQEVLRSQPDPVRSFLLQTSILDRLCGPLCEAVVRFPQPEAIDCQAILGTIEKDHLFVIPLDTEQRWYRYHHLFKEVLSRRLEGLALDQIPGLHRRASNWFEQHGFIHEAIQHAMKATDSDHVARLVEQNGCDLLMAGELVTLTNWLAVIDSYTHTRPWLAVQKAWVLSLTGQVERADGTINEGEQLISSLELSDEVRTLRGSFIAARALWANMQGKTDLAARYAKQAIEWLRVGNDFSCALRSVATSLLGEASWVEGKLEDARNAYEEAVQIGKISGNAHMTMMSLVSLADIHFEQGQLHRAAKYYAETLQMAEQVDGPGSAYALGAHFGLGNVYYARNRLEEAHTSLTGSCQLSQRWENLNLRAACFALLAQVENAQGNFEKAISNALFAEELIQGHSLSPYWSRWVQSALTRFWLDQGKIENALLLLCEMGVLPGNTRPETLSIAGIPLDHPIPYRLIPAYLNLTHLMLLMGNTDAVLTISGHLLKEACSWNWGKVEVELLVLKALAFQAKKDTALSLAALNQAVASAWSEQFIRVFLTEGEGMGKLLYQAKVRGMGGEFVEELLALTGKPTSTVQPVYPIVREILAVTKAGSGQQLLIEPLSERELEVLNAIAEGCSNQEIASRFVLSPLTVKRHISNIYAKLEAKNRTQAVSLARTLKLIN